MRQSLLEHSGNYRRSHRTSVVLRAGGGIRHYQHDYLRIVRRGERSKGRNVGHSVLAGGRKALIVFVDLLGRTGLSADTVAVDVCVASAVIINNGFQYIPHGGGGFLGYYLALDTGFCGLYHVPVGIQHLIYDIGSYKVAAVDDSAKRGRHLERSNLVGLTET